MREADWGPKPLGVSRDWIYVTLELYRHSKVLFKDVRVVSSNTMWRSGQGPWVMV